MWTRSPGREDPGKETATPPVFYSLEDPPDRGAWRATVPKSQRDTTERRSTHARVCIWLIARVQVHLLAKTDSSGEACGELHHLL